MKASGRQKMAWVGEQVKQRDGGQLPVWNGTSRWYVAKLDRYFADFGHAVEAAMGAAVTWKRISGGDRV